MNITLWQPDFSELLSVEDSIDICEPFLISTEKRAVSGVKIILKEYTTTPLSFIDLNILRLCIDNYLKRKDSTKEYARFILRTLGSIFAEMIKKGILTKNPALELLSELKEK